MTKTAYAQRRMERLKEKINDLVAWCEDTGSEDIGDRAKSKFKNLEEQLIRLGWEANANEF